MYMTEATYESVNETAQVEKFSPDELTTLRVELLKCRSDSRHAAELLSKFLAGRGYGVNATTVRTMVPGLGAIRCSHESMQSVLERIAFVM
jgi:hypothetical protein